MLKQEKGENFNIMGIYRKDQMNIVILKNTPEINSLDGFNSRLNTTEDRIISELYTG